MLGKECKAQSFENWKRIGAALLICPATRLVGAPGAEASWGTFRRGSGRDA
jgi:hypothetical protein